MALQVAAIAAATWFLVATTRTAWPRLAGLEGTTNVAVAPLLLASLLTAATYFFLIGTWVASLRWWGQALTYRDAVGIWFPTNLARFIPGAIWQFAGLGAMAVARGISPVAATGAILLQQFVLLATGLLVTVAMAPDLLGAWADGIPHSALLAAAVLGAAAVVWTFPWIAARLRPALARVLRRDFTWPVPPLRGLAAFVTGLTVPWVVYGVAFWLFGRAVLGPAGPDLSLALAAYTASYVAGILAVLAPGGIVVREAALVAALAPQLGPDRALVLAVGSRVWLTALELVTAIAALLVVRRRATPFRA